MTLKVRLVDTKKWVPVTRAELVAILSSPKQITSKNINKFTRLKFI